MTYTADVAGRKRFVDRVRGELHKKSRQKSEEWGILTLKISRITCPYKKGRMKRSLWRGAKENIFLFHRAGKGMITVEVGSKVPYAEIVERGVRRAYPIPKSGTMPKGKYLRFIGKDGKVHFSKGVIHPRMKGLFIIKNASRIASRMVFK